MRQHSVKLNHREVIQISTTSEMKEIRHEILQKQNPRFSGHFVRACFDDYLLRRGWEQRKPGNTFARKWLDIKSVRHRFRGRLDYREIGKIEGRQR
jgi:hypothetical protein